MKDVEEVAKDMEKLSTLFEARSKTDNHLQGLRCKCGLCDWGMSLNLGGETDPFSALMMKLLGEEFVLTESVVFMSRLIAAHLITKHPKEWTETTGWDAEDAAANKDIARAIQRGTADRKI